MSRPPNLSFTGPVNDATRELLFQIADVYVHAGTLKSGTSFSGPTHAALYGHTSYVNARGNGQYLRGWTRGSHIVPSAKIRRALAHSTSGAGTAAAANARRRKKAEKISAWSEAVLACARARELACAARALHVSKITIGLPVYNGEATVEATLDACSPIHTMILRRRGAITPQRMQRRPFHTRYAQRDSRIRVADLSNMGLNGELLVSHRIGTNAAFRLVRRRRRTATHVHRALPKSGLEGCSGCGNLPPPCHFRARQW